MSTSRGSPRAGQPQRGSPRVGESRGSPRSGDKGKGNKAHPHPQGGGTDGREAKYKDVGTLISPEGRYDGPLKENMRHTHQCSKDGEAFGHAEKCECTATGRLVWANGDVYEGQFRDGLREGPGVYTWSRGRRSYDGEWLKGQKGGGVGMEKWPNGDVYEGAYEAGFFHGHGALRTRLSKYVGDFAHGRKEGHGRMEWFTGDVYDGDWHDHCMHGEGEYFCRDGRSYAGEWMLGKRHGRGMELNMDGEKYDGDWVDNEKHGPAVYRWPNGRWREGLWVRNTRLKWLGEERIGGARRKVQRRGAIKTKHKELASQQSAAEGAVRAQQAIAPTFEY